MTPALKAFVKAFAAETKARDVAWELNDVVPYYKGQQLLRPLAGTPVSLLGPFGSTPDRYYQQQIHNAVHPEEIACPLRFMSGCYGTLTAGDFNGLDEEESLLVAFAADDDQSENVDPIAVIELQAALYHAVGLQ